MNYRPGQNKLLAIQGEILSIEDVKAFSDFCEATCANLFAYSPYQLHVDREQFLLFQDQADELKDGLGGAEVKVESLKELCRCLKELYSELMRNCWEAYTDGYDPRSESGKFMATQLIAVRMYNNRVKNEKMQ